MKSLRSLICALSFFSLESTQAALIYESAVENPDPAGGWGYSGDQMIGSRFTLSASTNVTAVGGHFMYTTGTSYAVIIALPDHDSLPAFEPEAIETNALAHAVFSTPSGNIFTDVTIPISITLPAGEYALLFGSGAFGTEGSAALTYESQPWYLDHSFFSTYTMNGGGVILDHFWWPHFSSDAYSSSMRFFVEGDGPAFVPPRDEPYNIPEPTTGLLCIGGLGLCFSRRRRG